jgi:hypothetical protein
MHCVLETSDDGTTFSRIDCREPSLCPKTCNKISSILRHRLAANCTWAHDATPDLKPMRRSARWGGKLIKTLLAQMGQLVKLIRSLRCAFSFRDGTGQGALRTRSVDTIADYASSAFRRFRVARNVPLMCAFLPIRSQSEPACGLAARKNHLWFPHQFFRFVLHMRTPLTGASLVSLFTQVKLHCMGA